MQGQGFLSYTFRDVILHLILAKRPRSDYRNVILDVAYAWHLVSSQILKKVSRKKLVCCLVCKDNEFIFQ